MTRAPSGYVPPHGPALHAALVELSFIEHVVDAFEKAHDVDPTIPRIAPIATRRALGAHHAAAKGGAAASAGGAAQPAGQGA